MYKDIRYVLTVVIDSEFMAATTMISSLTEYMPRVYVGKIGKYPIGLIHTEMGMDSLMNLQMCIPYFPSAKYLVAVGVCCGNSREEVNFGDVIISNEIQATGLAKYSQDGLVFRGRSMHPDIRHIFCDDRDLVPKFQVSKSGRNAKYYAKKILSAPWVINDPALKKKLMDAAGNAYGSEMEGESLMKLQDDYPNIQVIVIKAVTDYGDGMKDKMWQLIGAQAAFHYVKYKIVESGMYFKYNLSKIKFFLSSKIKNDGSQSIMVQMSLLNLIVHVYSMVLKIVTFVTFIF